MRCDTEPRIANAKPQCSCVVDGDLSELQDTLERSGSYVADKGIGLAVDQIDSSKGIAKLIGVVPVLGDVIGLIVEEAWTNHLQTDADNDTFRPWLAESLDPAGRATPFTACRVADVLDRQLRDMGDRLWDLMSSNLRVGRSVSREAILKYAASAVVDPGSRDFAFEFQRAPVANFINAHGAARGGEDFLLTVAGGRIMTEIGYVTDMLSDARASLREQSTPHAFIRRCQGGPVRGPGSDVSDSIPALLSDGEWVLRAGAANALGDTALSMLNQWDTLTPGQQSALNSLIVPTGAAFRATGGAIGDAPSVLLGGSEFGIAAAVEQLAQLKARMEGVEGVTKATRGEFETLSKTISAVVGNAKARLTEATSAFESYRKVVSDAVRQGHGLSDAAGAQAKAQDELTEALKKQEEAQRQLAIARASGTDASVSSATRKLAESDQEVAAAKAKDGGFLSFLQQNVDSAKTFADQLESLRLSGATLEVTQKIAQLGASTGGRVVSELLAGGQEAIEKANELVETVEDVGLRAGEAAAQQFFGAGIASARAFVDALTLQMETVIQPMLDSMRKMIDDAVAGAGATTANQQQEHEDNLPRVPSFTAARAQEASAAFGATKFASALATMGITPFADGGVVVRPTVGLIGEAGPEAIIPLNRFGGSKGGGDIIVNLVVHGSVVQESDLVVSVRDGIAQLMRRRGLDPAIIGV